MSAKHMLGEVYWQAADVSLGGDCLVDPPAPSLVGSELDLCWRFLVSCSAAAAQSRSSTYLAALCVFLESWEPASMIVL